MKWIRSTKEWTLGEKRKFKFDRDSTKYEGRFRLYPINKLTRHHSTTTHTDGVKEKLGVDPKTKEVIVYALAFDKRIWDEDKAKDWWSKNKKKYMFFDERETKSAEFMMNKDPDYRWRAYENLTPITPKEYPDGLR